ncbi:MAG: DedA family protein, partial [Comamonas sp.]
MEVWIHQLLQWLSLPELGLSTVFIVALISATLLPLGSEPLVAALVSANPALFWPAILVATAGNTIGGAISWWMGLGAQRAWSKARKLRHQQDGAPAQKSLR